MGKTGPKGNHYEYQGETIVGLRRDKKSGRFFPVGKGSPSFGSDPPNAIHRFRRWVAEQGEQPAPLIPVKMPSTIDALDVVVGYAGKDEPGRPYIPATVSPGLIETNVEAIRRQERDRLRNLIFSNPAKAATELNCEPLALLANVQDLSPPQPSKRLTELCDTYLDDKTLSRDETTSSRTWWAEFRKITKAKTITDLNRQSFKTYRKTIKDRQGNHSNAWVRSRFGKIKTIVKHAIVEMGLTEREKLILSDMALLKQPPKPAPKPVDIPPRQMQAILSKADKFQKALILLALNAAYTNIDCKRLRWDMIDFDNGTIRFDRSKSQSLTNQPLPRICCLWKRTIQALKSIKNGHTNVFLSSLGKPIDRITIGRHFARCCKAANVNGATFKHLRKSALTAASNDPSAVPDRQINLLAGHSAGIKEHYVVRRNVLLACEAIERYYFGGKR